MEEGEDRMIPSKTKRAVEDEMAPGN